jgi:hypothetical protein
MKITEFIDNGYRYNLRKLTNDEMIEYNENFHEDRCLCDLCCFYEQGQYGCNHGLNIRHRSQLISLCEDDEVWENTKIEE